MPDKNDLADREKALKDQEASFSEKQAGLADREAALAKREEKQKQAETTAHLKDINDFAEELTAGGQLLPRDKDGLIAFMANMNPESTLEFADGETTRKAATGEWFRQFLKAMPKQVDYSEHSSPEDKTSAVNFAAPSGYTVDQERLELHRKAVEFQAQNQCDYMTAVKSVGG